MLRRGRFAPWIALVNALAISVSVFATPSREAVTSIRPLLIRAAATGEAHGTLVGPAADAIASQFVSRAPIEVDVVAIADLGKPGCKRLRVDTHQDQVVDRERARAPGQPGSPLPARPMRLQYLISYCVDGSFAPGAKGAASSASSAADRGAGR